MGSIIWKDVEGWSNYQVSNTGQVKNIKFNRVMSPFSDGNYLQTSFSQNGKRNVRRIHLTVADAFHPNPDNLPCVNHEDGNKQNNHESNLKRCTDQYNAEHSVKMGLRNPKKTFKNKGYFIAAVRLAVSF